MTEHSKTKPTKVIDLILASDGKEMLEMHNAEDKDLRIKALEFSLSLGRKRDLYLIDGPQETASILVKDAKIFYEFLSGKETEK
ncbi:hypothetical protein FAI40_01745 [Acetobacteraceae bacterium]|nr:hypothetical protein FAI40_01745 [Acetobacteraceae bacterium]